MCFFFLLSWENWVYTGKLKKVWPVDYSSAAYIYNLCELLNDLFQNSVIFGPFAIMPFLILNGFFVRLKDAHPYLHWLFHISFLKYAFEGVMIAIYG